MREGHWYRWLDAYCALMLSGEGSRLAWDCSEVPAYAALPLSRRSPVRAFVGLPLCAPDGVAWGALCAADPLPQTDDLLVFRPMLELLARLLASLRAAQPMAGLTGPAR